MADGEWTDLEVSRAVLESWFSRSFSSEDMKDILRTLLAAELVSCRIHTRTADAARVVQEKNLAAIEFKASGNGLRYLASTSGRAA
jgi:hypothetical protein